MSDTKALRAGAFASLTAAVAGILLSSTSCATEYDPNQRIAIIAPDYDIYKTYLDDYLNRRCGTLDCHGQPGRAYRSYGRIGYRIPNLVTGDAQVPAQVSGLQPTTDRERRANYEGIIALEPEEMSRVVARNGENPKTLLFIRKALSAESPSGERHKGGQVMSEDDVAYRCLTAWLRYPSKYVPGAVPGPVPVGDAGGDARVDAAAVDAGLGPVPADLIAACSKLDAFK
jgi:hypothetical protein